MSLSTSIKKPKLDVLIATHGVDGLRQVAEMTIPQVEGVKYIVSWQTDISVEDSNQHKYDIPSELQRDDISIYPINSKGLSNNRNALMKLSSAGYCLIADNDLHYTAEGLKAVCKCLDENPDTDIATFRHDGENIVYPSEITDLGKRLPKGYSVTSVEIAYRRNRIGNIRFDPNFGIGSVLGSAEDPIFLLDCRRKGLHCRFFPISIVKHNGPSTGQRTIKDGSIAAAEGAYIRLEYGIAGFPRILLFAWRAKRKKRMSFFWGLRHLTRGFFSKYVKIHRQSLYEETAGDVRV